MAYNNQNNFGGYYDQNEQSQYEHYDDQDYEEYDENLNADDYDQMEEMEREMQMGPTSNSHYPTPQTGPKPSNRGGSVPVGAMPSQGGVLSPHAAEFWFPECRNCPCCKGFKHGCDCRKTGVNTCTDPNCIDQEHSAQVSRSLSDRTPATAITTAVFTPASASRANVAVSASTTCTQPLTLSSRQISDQTSNQSCKFYNTGSCKFGDSCRFLHLPKGDAAPAAMLPAAVRSGVTVSNNTCLYFAQGRCNQGRRFFFVC